MFVYNGGDYNQIDYVYKEDGKKELIYLKGANEDNGLKQAKELFEKN